MVRQYVVLLHRVQAQYLASKTSHHAPKLTGS
jgi:hypothetical protein